MFLIVLVGSYFGKNGMLVVGRMALLGFLVFGSVLGVLLLLFFLYY